MALDQRKISCPSTPSIPDQVAAFLCVWFRVADWTVYDLAKAGAEGAVLIPLGQHSKAATFISRAASTSSSYLHRKIAADLAGWIQQPPLDLLSLLFEQERNRNRELPAKEAAKGALDENGRTAIGELVKTAARYDAAYTK
jgi:hypothetical protein